MFPASTTLTDACSEHRSCDGETRHLAMTNITLEVCVDTPDDAATAASAGAGRIEICSSLEIGGVTPGPGLVRSATACNIPVFAMIRPRAGDFDYSAAEIDSMVTDIEFFLDCGVSGFVFGVLDSRGRLEERSLEKLIASCDGMPTTLHRAFDHCSDPLQSLEVAVQLGFDRILTSGASPTANAGLPLLKKLFAKADGRIIIMPCGDVTPATVDRLLDNLPVQEIHASCKSPIVPARKTGSEVNVGRVDVQDRFATDPEILRELLNVMNSRQETASIQVTNGKERS